MEYDIEKYNLAKQMYINGYSLSEINKEIGFERHKLSYLLKKDNITINKNGSKYKYKEDFFEKIDTEEKAYWLGFIYADGNVINYGKYEIKISLAYKDLDHVKKFANTILLDGNGNNLIREFDAILKGKKYPSAKVCITNKKIVEDIIKLGCLPNKSLILTFPSEDIVPKELQRHFIRGYFDGDGSIYNKENDKTPTISFIGTQNFLYSIMKIFDNICVKKQKWSFIKKQNQKAYQFSKKHYDTNKIIYEYLYKDSCIYLERKYNRFVEKYGKL